ERADPVPWLHVEPPERVGETPHAPLRLGIVVAVDRAVHTARDDLRLPMIGRRVLDGARDHERHVHDQAWQHIRSSPLALAKARRPLLDEGLQALAHVAAHGAENLVAVLDRGVARLAHGPASSLRACRGFAYERGRGSIAPLARTPRWSTPRRGSPAPLTPRTPPRYCPRIRPAGPMSGGSARKVSGARTRVRSSDVVRGARADGLTVSKERGVPEPQSLGERLACD